jgi:nitrite reductase/ring-hydroxylating ferredoxin subunit/uncharacterized membrane protein
MRTLRPLDTMVEQIEASAALDPLAAKLNALLRKVIPHGPVEDVLSGTPAGHPLHPALVAVPIGAWTSAGILDLLGDDGAARRLIAIGCVSAVPAAASGATDWLSTDGAERRVGLVHALLNYGALTAYGLSWFSRRRGARGHGVALSLAGAGLLSAAGWLGGHLAYAQGVGVDTTVFQHLPQEWTDAGAEAELAPEGAVVRLSAAGIPLLVTRRSGRVVAMSERCTHRGGPLTDGPVEGGCIVCPWHGSTFSLDDGGVRRGPASRSQPVLETRLRDGRVEVRRTEHRALRTNPVGS